MTTTNTELLEVQTEQKEQFFIPDLTVNPNFKIPEAPAEIQEEQKLFIKSAQKQFSYVNGVYWKVAFLVFLLMSANSAEAGNLSSELLKQCADYKTTYKDWDEFEKYFFDFMQSSLVNQNPNNPIITCFKVFKNLFQEILVGFHN